jgi:O-methyltransferase/aklanonic acid methyltransferase
MTDIWGKLAGTGEDGPDYWEYFGIRLVAHAHLFNGACVLDVGCGCGSSVFPAAERVGPSGRVTGIDICPH